MDEIEEVLSRGVENIYPSKKALEKALRSGKKLRLYQGFDPSMPSLHLGNFAGLMKLRQFQKLGHEVIFLVGDFTGMIGDPTDKLAARRMLSREEVKKNAQSWKEQASRVLDFEGPKAVRFMFNSAWNDKVTFKDLIETTSKFTVQQMLERDMFQERLKEGKPIYLHEFLYPVAQAIDCVEMDVDLEIGGSDQTFNMLAGRHLMKALKDKEKFVLTTKLLVDAQGQKVGKTTGNALFLDSTPEQFYGGVMAFPDEVIVLGFELLTEVPFVPQEIEKEVQKDPLGAKKRLAFEIVKLLWGESSAQKAQSEFERVFQKGKMPKENLIVFKAKSGAIEAGDLLLQSGAATSGTVAKSLIKQGAVDVDKKTITDIHENVKVGSTVKVGKKTFIKIE
ncbi:MAG TPA: tyrosine--tRNA ligase [Clostridia bacterium]|nr:tyrosine--tRNA ligase [Clostridia bacterium]